MNLITDKNITIDLTAGTQRLLLLSLLIISILSLYSCSMPSPTNSGSSSGGGAPSSGGSMPSSGGGSGGSSGDKSGSPPNTGGGAPSPGGGVSDPGDSSASPSGGDADTEESGDSIEGLDEALDESLEDFDETVLSDGNRGGNSDNQSIDILSPSGTSGGIDSDEPLFEEADSGAIEGNPSIEQRAAEGAPPGADGSGAEVPAGQAANSSGPEQGEAEIIPIPDDIDDGQGDDIVLRQIRDAALKERDPILREKLWDEYRRIKNQG